METMSAKVKSDRAFLKQPYRLLPCCLEEAEEVAHTVEYKYPNE
jgi:hypothetical protein